MIPETAAQPIEPGDEPVARGVLAELNGAIASAFSAVAGFLELASMELRRAGLSLVWMAACGLAGAVCLLASWFGVLAGLAIWAISLGLPTPTTLFGLAAVNGVAGVILLRLGVGKSEDLRFPATRRQFAALERTTDGSAP